MVKRYQTLYVASCCTEAAESVPEILRSERVSLLRQIAVITTRAQKALHGDGDPEAYLRHAHTARLLEGQLASLDHMLGLP